ncbi:MAG: protein kinase [Polyangiaceae bacterium]|nr:protein kinase [Polyangiaceae bacterium]
MPATVDAELSACVAEGVLSSAEAERVRTQAASEGKLPLDLLFEQGKLSPDTLAAIRQRLEDSVHDSGDSTVTLPPKGAQALWPNTDPAATPEGDPTPASPRLAPTSPPREEDFPIKRWDRYRNIRYLGGGGMGRVFLVVDNQLRRHVALKFVRPQHHQYASDLVDEARAQARVVHERVCKVYDVGEKDGHVYIAMQYVDGFALTQIAEQLTLEQKVNLVKQAAAGVHAAHQVGIIHRDLKPGNIMVERSPNGRARAIVMDFGLARHWKELAQGNVPPMGTPAYMSPEQATGKVRQLDRRTDVYSLGATLYHLVTGSPIAEGKPTEIIDKVLHRAPVPPRVKNPDIPIDLEAVILKCLEKNRSARYQSAKALIDDLDRFLAGDAVSALNDRVYRARRYLRKRRRPILILSPLIVLLMLLSINTVLSRREARHREQLARTFTERAERLEAAARYAALSPLHNIEHDRSELVTQMDELRRQIGESGDLAKGPGDYALGRGYLALGNDVEARKHLESAYNGGYRDPRVAYALALALGHLYKRDLIDAEKLNAQGAREEAVKKAQALYRDQALKLLREAGDSHAPSKEYVAALLAYYEDRYDDALIPLVAAGQDLPWLYEVEGLRGDVHLARARSLTRDGQVDAARKEFDAAREAYAAACRIGESVPELWEALGALEYHALVMEEYTVGEVQTPYEKGMFAVNQALTALPTSALALILRGQLDRAKAQHLVATRGQGIEEHLTAALRDVERAASLGAQPSHAQLELSRIHWQWAHYQLTQGLDPTAHLELAQKFSLDGKKDGSSEKTPSADDYANLGQIYKTWAEYDDKHGLDSTAHRASSIDAYTRALELEPTAVDLLVNLGSNHLAAARSHQNKDPQAELKKALEKLEKAAELSPKNVIAWYYLGNGRSELALHERAAGQNSSAQFALAAEAFEHAISHNPSAPYLHNGLGIVFLEQAKDAWDAGEPVDPLLTKALRAFGEGIAAAFPQPHGLVNQSETWIMQAEYELLSDKDPSLALQNAESLLNLAERIPNAGVFNTLRVRLLVTSAAHAWKNKKPFEQQLNSALDIAAKEAEKNPDNAEAQRRLGEALWLKGQVLSGGKEASGEFFQNAENALLKASSLAPIDQEIQLNLVRLYLDWATSLAAKKEPFEAVRDRGVKLVKSLVLRRPNWRHALTAQTALVQRF